MAYCTLAGLRAYLGITETDDDDLLQGFISHAQQMIDKDRNRSFEALTATKYYTYADVSGSVLWLGADLLTVTTLSNGDASATEIPAAGYWLQPRNETPKVAIKLKSSYYWTVDADCEIAVAGTWGYSTEAPADIQLACMRLAAYLYRGRDSQVFDVTADPTMGVITVPKGMPQDVRVILDRYPRRMVYR
jgi:hypothetical protein